MNWNSSENWRMRRRGNFWIFPLIFLALIILTHGWILFLPLMVLAAFVFFGFVLPRIMWHVHNGGWHEGGWDDPAWNDRAWHNNQWNSSDWNNRDWSAWASRWQEKHKRHFQDWGDWGDKPKNGDDDIEYV